MVSTRVVSFAAALVLWFSVGSGWVLTVDTTSPVNVMDLATSVGGQYGVCQCPPSSSAPETEALLILNPLLVGPDLLGVTTVAFSLALALSFICFFRWKLTLFAGILALVSGVSWIVGLGLARDYLFSQYAIWDATTHDISKPVFSPVIGPYIAASAGAIYLACYLLSRVDVLEWPKD